MEQLNELQEHLTRLPHRLAHANLLDDAVQSKLYGVSLALRALSDLESERRLLERTCRRITSLSQTLTGEWSDEVRQALLLPPSESSQRAGPSIYRSVSSSTTASPSKAAAADGGGTQKLGELPTGKPSAMPGSSGLASRDQAVRLALKRETKEFADRYTQALERFDRSWSSACEHAVGSLDRTSAWSPLASSLGQNQATGSGRPLPSAQPLSDGPRLWTSWIACETKNVSEATSVTLSSKSASLLLKVLRFGMGHISALAASMVKMSASAESGSDAPGCGRLLTEDVVAIFGVLTAARGVEGALELAEELFVQVISQKNGLDQREADLLLTAVLDAIQLIDTGEAKDAGPTQETKKATSSSYRNPLVASPALELELLAYLDCSRRWEAKHRPAHPISSSVRGPLSSSSPVHDSYASIRSLGAPAVASSLSSLGSNAAEVWSSSVQTGMTTISGLLSAGGSIGSKLIGRAGRDGAVAGSDLSTVVDEVEASGPSLAAEKTTATSQPKQHTIRAPPSLSASRFVTPTSGANATTAKVHAAASDLSRSSSASGSTDLKSLASGNDLYTAATGSITQRVDPTVTAAASTPQKIRDAHTALEAIASASASMTSPSSPSPIKLAERSTSGHGRAIQGADGKTDLPDPIAIFATRVAEILVGATRGDAPTRASIEGKVRLPLACRLSRRLLGRRFPAEAYREENRRVRLIIVVRWFAFTVLRGLVTQPEAMDRSVGGGSLAWAVHSTALTADGLSLGHEMREVVSDKNTRAFEDVWTSDELSCRALNGLHRALYSGLVRCAEVSSHQSRSEPIDEDLIRACRPIVDLFGAHGLADAKAEDLDGIPSSMSQARDCHIRVLTLAPHEAFSFTKAATMAFVDAAARSSELEPSGSLPTTANARSVRRQAGLEDVEVLLQELKAIGEGIRGQSTSTDQYQLPLIYTAYDPEHRQMYVNTFLHEIEESIGNSKQQALPQRSTGFALRMQGGTDVLDKAASQSVEPGTLTSSGSGFSVASSSAGLAAGQSSSGSDWNSPPCSPFAEKTLDSLFSLDAKIIETARRDGAATPTAAPTARHARDGTGTTLQTPAGRHFPEKSAGLPTLGRDSTHSSLLHRASTQTDRPARWDPRQLPVDEIQRGILAMIRRGYMHKGSEGLLPSLQSASQRAEEQESFVDAALFRQTARLLSYCVRVDPSLRVSRQTEHPSDFAKLLEHILQPFAEADRKHRTRVHVAQERLLLLDASWAGLVTKARVLHTSLQEVRIRCWYAAEIRASTDVAKSVVAALLSLHQVHPSQNQGSEAGEEGWLESLGIHSLRLPKPKAAFVRQLDPAFQRIVRDAGSFFASSLWSREAALATPFLLRPQRKAEPGQGGRHPTQTMFAFGAGTTSLLYPGESASDTLVGLESFLQRVQLSATGLLLSEALASAAESEVSGRRVLIPPAERHDPDTWVNDTIGPVAENLQHADAELAARLSSMGADRLLRRFDLHPSPHHKMRALFGLTRLIVAQLSFTEVPELPEASTRCEDRLKPPGPEEARNRRGQASGSNLTQSIAVEVGSGKRTSLWNRRTAINELDGQDAKSRRSFAPSVASSGAAPLVTSRPASIGGLSSHGNRPRRALSMYLDDPDEDGEGGREADDLANEPVNMPNIHDLLALMSDGRSGPSSLAPAPLPPTTGESPKLAPTFGPPPDAGRTAADDAPSLQVKEPPSTDALLNALESLLIHTLTPQRGSNADFSRPSGRPLSQLYLHLQLICAFSPTAILDWKEQGKALWDVVLAACSVRNEVALRSLERTRQEQHIEHGFSEPVPDQERRRILSVLQIALAENLALTTDELALIQPVP